MVYNLSSRIAPMAYKTKTDKEKPSPMVNPKRGERLLKLMKYRGDISQTELAHRINVTQGAINKILKGGGSTLLPAICRELNCSIDWLDTGKGPSPWQEIGRRGQIPVVEWHKIPHICKDLDKLVDLSSHYIDLAFPKEDDLFASFIPKSLVPGHSSNYFQPEDLILISPHRELASSQHVVVIEDDWLEPVYAHYWIQGENKTIKYPWEMRLKRLTPKMKICGVVVARINIFI